MSPAQLTPKELGYRMPAEWERQEAIWLSWPHNKEWWGGEVSTVEQSYGRWVEALSAGQEMNILVPNKKVKERACDVLKDYTVSLHNLNFYSIKTGEIYIRDYGPTFVVNAITGQKAMVNWDFNAWGGKYENSLRDTIVPDKMNHYLKLPVFKPGIVMEGGAIDVNGSGSVLTTESVLLNPNRNAHLGKGELEKYLCDYLGVSNVLWLNEGLFGDDTDGHIDDIARFVNSYTVLCAYEEDHNDVNYPALDENYERLRRMKNERGDLLSVVKVPMAKVEAEEHLHTGSARKPASYLNFYIANSAVVVPIFGDYNDTRALSIIQRFFMERRVVGINCAKMVLDGGTLHCASQQEPVYGTSKWKK